MSPIAAARLDERLLRAALDGATAGEVEALVHDLADDEAGRAGAVRLAAELAAQPGARAQAARARLGELLDHVMAVLAEREELLAGEARAGAAARGKEGE